MKKYLVLVIALVSLLSVLPAIAVQRSGNDMLVDCGNLVKTESLETVSSDNVLGMGYCIGFIDGLVTFNYVFEAVLLREGKDEFLQMCLPDRISTRQLATTIVKFLEANPGRLTQSGQALASQALVEAYPCEQEKAE
jgi:hypothetical protein